MGQVHKRFSDEQVAFLLQEYSQGLMTRLEVQEVLGIGRSRFFSLRRGSHRHRDARRQGTRCKQGRGPEVQKLRGRDGDQDTRAVHRRRPGRGDLQSSVAHVRSGPSDTADFPLSSLVARSVAAFWALLPPGKTRGRLAAPSPGLRMGTSGRLGIRP